MNGCGRRGMWTVLALAISIAGAAPLSASDLVYRGQVLSRRQVEREVAPALAAPRDTAALRSSLDRIVAGLQDLGYLDARAAARWPGEGTLELEVREGARYRIAPLVIRAAGSEDSARIASTFDLAQGSWASPRAVREATERSVATLVAGGHAYAEVGVAKWQPDAGAVEVAIEGIPGPRVDIVDARVEGLHVTRESVTRRIVGPLEGRPYDPAEAEAARDRLAELGLFRSVRFEGLEAAGDWSRGRLQYRVEEQPYTRFEGVVGVQGEGQVVGLVRLDLANLLGTGRATALRWDARGEDRTELGARFTEPLLFGLPLKAEVAMDHEIRDTTFVRTRGGARLGWSLPGSERIEGGVEVERVIENVPATAEASVRSATFAFERRAVDDRLDPRRGVDFRIQAAQSFTTEKAAGLVTERRASAAEARVGWYRRLRRVDGLAVETRAAGRFSSEETLELYERYPLGGSTTLRGYDEEEFRVDRFVLVRSEWRRTIGAGGQRVFLFWDHAWMSTRRAEEAGGAVTDRLQKDGVGMGLRIATRGGSAGIEYGLEPGRPPLEGKIHLRLISSF